jgi:hypothetical protein
MKLLGVASSCLGKTGRNAAIPNRRLPDIIRWP